MGVYVGKHIARRIAADDKLGSGSSVVEPFEYRHAGSFSYVGDGSAVMEVEVPLFGKVVLKGRGPLCSISCCLKTTANLFENYRALQLL